ncbi:MFS transporter [Amorphoplanes nipponensis]|uniref:MFS transporter n=1 Tax=Actinoplanes nipponensis TaxID=135950 RepID=A0A919JHD2_9ACTN|nr:MFS transporter [Actinoplanes nipponensis]GIE49231.1 MFS transporter [Actinoplanes nipponensis]
MTGGSRRAVAVLCGIQFVDVLGVTSGITALPAMLAGVSAPAEATPVLATAYAMLFGGLLVVGARLGDRYGHRRVLLAGCVAFALVSLVGASAREIVQLVAARGLQGAAAAISVPSALRLLLDAAPEPDERRGALAAWSASGAAAGALGLLVGGVLTGILGWRAVFWVNLPVGLVLVVAVLVVVAPAARAPERVRLDLPGAALLTGAVMTLIVGASLLESPAGRTTGGLLVAAGLAAGAGFVARQRRARAPLVPRAALASANLRTGTAVSFVNTAATSSAGVLATLALQRDLGVSAVGAGFALVPFSLGVVAGSALTRPLGARLSVRWLAAAGLGGIAAGNLLLVATYGGVAGIVAGVAVAGIGLGTASVAATAIGTDVPEELGGTASGVLNTGAQLGTALGVAGLLLLAATVGGSRAGTATAWAVAAGLAGGTALVLVPRRAGTGRGTADRDEDAADRSPRGADNR